MGEKEESKQSLLGNALPRVTKIKESSNLCEDTNMGVVRCGILYRRQLFSQAQQYLLIHNTVWAGIITIGIPLHYYTEINKAGLVSCAWRAFLSDNDSHVVGLRTFIFIGYATICEYWVGSNAPRLTLFIHSRSQWVVTCLHSCYWSL